MSMPMTETRQRRGRHARPLATKSAGRRSSAAIPHSTASSCSPSAPPASIAGRAAPRGRRSGRTSHSSRPARTPRRRATAPASAAGPTSSARPIRKSRRSSGRANGSKRAEEAPKLADLAASVGLSPYHFHRVFKAITGVTPKAYAAETRARRAADKLRTAETVTEAIYDAGFNSSSRFYENTAARLGMTPGAVRRGGAGAVIRFAVGEASLGAVLVAATTRACARSCSATTRKRLCATCRIAFRARSSRAVTPNSSARSLKSSASSRRPVSVWIFRSTSAAPRSSSGCGRRSAPSLPARRRPTRRSPARSASRPPCARSPRLAAPIPLAVAIPCHRVVRSDGDLSGYRWGVERKRKLIDREAA